MNIKVGLVRTWIVLAIFYWASQLFNARVPDAPQISWQYLSWVFLMPPIVLAIVLVAVGWILKGFIQKPKTPES